MDILFAVCVVAGIGLIIGLILAVASIIMAVPKDEKTESVLQALPGANCGACGYSGCSGYAAALAKGEAENGLCSPGGEKTANEIAKILGIGAGAAKKKVAVVHCLGSFDNTTEKVNYQGINSCAAVAKVGGGNSSCLYGCLGCGDCVEACSFNSIKVCNGVAVVNSSTCSGCAKCASVCPKGLISIIPLQKTAVVRCSNCDKGVQTRKVCKTGCIGCMKCVKVCSAGAVSVSNFCAVVNLELCTGCGECISQCPQGCIILNTD